MGRVFESIDSNLEQWLEKQPLFFVGTAPSGDDGHLNISPKGGVGLFKVTGPLQIAYLDLIGSGAETIAHLRENGRIVLMFCAFNGAPKIIRLHGLGRTVGTGDPEFSELISRFQPSEEISAISRTIIVVEVARVADSCGFMVPRMEMVAERDQLMRWAERQGERHGDGWKDRYIQANNTFSIDGLPAIEPREQSDEAELTVLSSDGRAL